MKISSMLLVAASVLSFSGLVFAADTFKAIDSEIVGTLGETFTLQGENSQGQPCTVKVKPTAFGHSITLVESQVSSVERESKNHKFESFRNREEAKRFGRAIRRESYIENSMFSRDFHGRINSSKVDSRGYTQDIESELTISLGKNYAGQVIVEFVALSKTISTDHLYAETIFSNEIASCHRRLP